MEKSRARGTTSCPTNLADGDLADRLSAAARSPVLTPIIAALGESAEVLLVGGAVRDCLLGIAELDFDLATLLRPERVVECMRRAGIYVVETGLKHGTVTAVSDGHNVEITTFRKPARHDEQAYSESIEEDLSGRDFTINAIAYRLSGGELLDPFGGISDLKAGLLRAVGDPRTRFGEDPLRIMRMFRFGPAEGRRVDEATARAARELAASLGGVSVERIRGELEKILVGPCPREALRAMLEAGALERCLPELMPAVGFEQNEFHVHDVFEHTLQVICNAPSERILRLAALFHDIGKPHTLSVDEQGRRHFYRHETVGEGITKRAMRRLKFSNEDIKAVTSLVKHHMRPLECGPAGLRRLIRDLGPYFEQWRDLKKADRPPVMEPREFSERVRAFDAMLEAELARQRQSGKDKLALNGDDVVALGIRPGPDVGKVLAALREAVIEQPELNEREKLLELARRQIESLGAPDRAE